MKSRTVRILAVLVVVLFGVLYALSTTRHDTVGTASELLAPDLKARLNDVSSVSITDSKGQLTIERADKGWQVREKDGYPANMATLGQVLRAVADAHKIEQKTASPELYDKLGVQNPADDGGDGVLVTTKGQDFSFSVIVGKTAQGDFRYARVPDDAQSWLIDKNPELPDTPAGWLKPDIVDIAPAAVQTVEIHHADGETIRLHKDNADATTFDVEGIPKGRELSYPTVVNGIAGALGNLTLDDVAKAGKDDALSDPANVRFETFDGLHIDIVAGRLGEDTWLTLHAAAEPGKATNEPEAATAESTQAEESVADATPASGNSDEAPAGTDVAAEKEDGAKADNKPAAAPTPEEKAAEINERTAGWRYQVASYKADQLTRRWEDLLKAKDDK